MCSVNVATGILQTQERKKKHFADLLKQSYKIHIIRCFAHMNDGFLP